MVVAPDVEDQVLGAVVGRLLADHPPIRLVGPVAAHAEVADRLPEVGRQRLLPGLAVADLMALGEAVAIGVDPAGLARVHERRPGAVGSGRRDRGAAVDAVARQVVAEDVAQLRVELRPARAAEEAIDHRSGDGAFPQKLFEGRLFGLGRRGDSGRGEQGHCPESDRLDDPAHGDRSDLVEKESPRVFRVEPSRSQQRGDAGGIDRPVEEPDTMAGILTRIPPQIPRDGRRSGRFAVGPHLGRKRRSLTVPIPVHSRQRAESIGFDPNLDSSCR